MSFESFVATGNALAAVELSRALARAEASAPSLLLLYGPPGSGKTHLLDAIREVARNKHPSAAIVRTNAIELVEEMLAAARRNRTGSVRPLWSPEALVTLDDLHTLSGKVVTQREVGRLLGSALARGCRLACAVGRLTEVPVLTEAVRALPSARIVELRRPNDVEVLQILAGMARDQRPTLTARTLVSIAAGCHGDVRRAAGAMARQRLQASATS